MKLIYWLCSAMFVFMLIGCNTLTLRPAEFSWPVEIVLKPDAKGNVQETRYHISFNVKALLFDAVQDSINVTKYSLRVIRDQDGFYFITAKGFKDVYIFADCEGALKLEKKLLINEKGLDAPAFNQKTAFIQLINEKNDEEPPILLSKNGIQGGEKK
ncbi:MAG TPA: hypothetical protein VMU30_04695 [Bacteroidota bacterium]|nr:hypothetical protein [Bacteroidota bacterium]